MDAAGTTSPASPPPTRVTWSDGVVELRDERVFGPGGESLCDRFLGAGPGVEGVRSVSLDRAQATAAIRHDAGPRGLPRLLERLSAAIRDGVSSGLEPGAAASDPGGDLHHPSPRIAVDDLRGPVRPARPAPAPPRRAPPGPRPRPGGRTTPGRAARRDPGDGRHLDVEPADPLRPGGPSALRVSCGSSRMSSTTRAGGAPRSPSRLGPGSAWRTRPWASRRRASSPSRP